MAPRWPSVRRSTRGLALPDPPRSQVVACALALILAASVVAVAQDGWKNTRTDRGNRYEGTIEEDAANPEWELLSFTVSRPRIAPSSALRVAFFLPARMAGAASTTVVLARELEDRHHYRMESKPGEWRPGTWNAFGPWKTADVVDGVAGLHDNIGVLVVPNRALATMTDVVPAAVLADAGAVDQAIEQYHVVMRSSRTASSLLYRLQRADAATAPLVERILPGDFIRGEPISLELPAPPAEGRYRLTICATPGRRLPEYRPATGGTCAEGDIERSYVFDHVGRVRLAAAVR
jgi:hypothetical protein